MTDSLLFTKEDVDLLRDRADGLKIGAADARWARDNMTVGHAAQIRTSEQYEEYSAQAERYTSLANRLQQWLDLCDQAYVLHATSQLIAEHPVIEETDLTEG